MSQRIKKPEYYRTPLRSRKSIADFLLGVGSYLGRDGSIFCFNVKAHGTDLSFDHLLEVFKGSGYGGGYLENDDYLEAAREKHEEVGENRLWEYGQEGAWRLVTDSDCYNHLWDGTPVDVEYGSAGRSSGYIVIRKFEGWNMSRTDRNYWRRVFEGCPHAEGTEAYDDWHLDYDDMPMDTLKKLYQLVVMLVHDFSQETAVKEIEYQAAFDFFENCCNRIPKPDARQLKLEFAGGDTSNG